MPQPQARPFRVAELDHVVLRCVHQQQTLEFYTGILGMTEERRIEKIGLIQLRAGHSMLDLVPAENLTDGGRNVDHFCLGIESAEFESLLSYLRERGVEMVGEPGTRYGARGMGLSVYVRDPEGNVVELKQMPAERMDV